MNYEALIYEKSDGIAKITLNRPEAMNTLNARLLSELSEAVEEAARDDGVNVVVITGAGRAFSAGGDLKWYSPLVRGEFPPLSRYEEGRVPGPVGQVVAGLQRIKDKPTIAMINGDAVGAGFVIASACDMRIGSEHARFMTGFNRIGLVSGEGGAWLLPRIVGLAKACELIFTGDVIEAEEAYRIGLLNRIVPAARLSEETVTLASRLARAAPIALRLDKRMIYEGMNTDIETALAFGSTCLAITLRSEDHKEGVAAFAEKRRPVFRGK